MAQKLRVYLPALHTLELKAEPMKNSAPLSAALNAVDADIIEAVRQDMQNEDADHAAADAYAPPKQRPTVVDVRLTIRAREAVHGDLAIFASILTRFKSVARDTPNWSKLSETHRVAIDEMLRALTSALVANPDLREHYDDIAGYAISAAERLTPRT